MKKPILILIIISMLFCSGCFNQKSLRDIAIVVGMGIDYDPDSTTGGDMVQITVEITDLDGSGKGGESDAEKKLFTSEGKTIIDAINGLNEQLNKKIFWGHLQTIVIGGDTLISGVKPYLDYFLKNQDISPMTDLVYTDSKARDLLEANIGLSFSPSLGMTLIMDQGKDDAGSLTPGITIQDLTEKTLKEDTAVILPWASIADEENKIIKFKGLAIMGHDGKLKGYLEGDERTATLLWMNMVEKLSITINENIPSNVSIWINNWKLERNWKQEEDGTLKLMLTSGFEAVLKEDSNYLFERPYSELKVITEDRIRELLLLAWEKSIYLNEDYLLLGDHLNKYYNDIWLDIKDNWPEEMNKIDLDIQINAKIKSEEK